MSWWHWLTLDGLSAADRVQTPALLVHADGCVLPENARQLYIRLRGRKKILWTTGDQTDFYDRPPQVDHAVDATDAFLKGAD
jgi:fermentation-respiration switch protein FrsA (DUF1100 family)